MERFTKWTKEEFRAAIEITEVDDGTELVAPVPKPTTLRQRMAPSIVFSWCGRKGAKLKISSCTSLSLVDAIDVIQLQIGKLREELVAREGAGRGSKAA